MTVTPRSVGDLVLGFSGHKYNSIGSGDNDTTNGSWTAASTQTANTRTASTSIAYSRQGKTVTATGQQTYNLQSAAGDIASLVLYFTNVTLAEAASTTATAKGIDFPKLDTYVSAVDGSGVLGTAAFITNETPTGATDTTGGSWSTADTVIANSGNPATSIALVVQTKIATNTHTGWFTPNAPGPFSIFYWEWVSGTPVLAQAGAAAVTATAVNPDFNPKQVNPGVATTTATAADARWGVRPPSRWRSV